MLRHVVALGKQLDSVKVIETHNLGLAWLGSKAATERERDREGGRERERDKLSSQNINSAVKEHLR